MIIRMIQKFENPKGNIYKSNVKYFLYDDNTSDTKI